MYEYLRCPRIVGGIRLLGAVDSSLLPTAERERNKLPCLYGNMRRMQAYTGCCSKVGRTMVGPCDCCIAAQIGSQRNTSTAKALS